MVDSNSQRSQISPCDKGKAYKMRLDAMNRQGKRTDLKSSPLGQKLKPVNSIDELAASVNDSPRQIARFIRLTYLAHELQQFVDEGKIKVNPAVITRVFGISKIPKIFRIQRVNTGRCNGIRPPKRHKKVPKAL